MRGDGESGTDRAGSAWIVGNSAYARGRVLCRSARWHRQVDLQSVAILQDFDLLPLNSRHPIIVTIKSGTAVLIGAPLMNLVRRRQMGRELGQIVAFMLKGISPAGCWKKVRLGNGKGLALPFRSSTPVAL